jgi:epsilon-lactone hydrolase
VTADRAGRRLRVPPAVMRLGVRQLGRRCLDPALPWPVQRSRLEMLAGPALLPRGISVAAHEIGGVRAEVVSPAARGGRSYARNSAAGDGRPAAAGPPLLTVVHFHGGGYCLGSARTARAWAAHLSAQTGCRVVLPGYRLAPEHPHPAALDDARAVLAELTAETGIGSLVLSGDSAGGGLALALVLSLRDEARPLPAGCILLSPWLDLSRDRHALAALVRADLLLSPDWLKACARAYAGQQDLADPAISPLRADLDGLPPLLIQAGTDELLAPDAEDLAIGAVAAGVDVTYTRWPRMWHDFALQAGQLAAADSAVEQAAWFARAVTGGTD